MKRTPLKRKTPMKRGGKLRAESPKRAKMNVEYRKLRKAFLAEHRGCQICKVLYSEDVHHREGRGPNLNRVETWMAVCRRCHDEIHANPKAAREKGYLK